MGGMRLPMSLSIAGHTVLLGLLILLATEAQPPPEPAANAGIEIVLGRSLLEQQTIPTAETARQPVAPPSVAAVPPQEIEEPEPAVVVIEPPPTPARESPASPVQTEPVPSLATAKIAPPPPPRKPVSRQPGEIYHAPAFAPGFHRADRRSDPICSGAADRAWRIATLGAATSRGRRSANP
jgi:outer membrane biosynthesis protein TonB